MISFRRVIYYMMLFQTSKLYNLFFCFGSYYACLSYSVGFLESYDCPIGIPSEIVTFIFSGTSIILICLLKSEELMLKQKYSNGSCTRSKISFLYRRSIIRKEWFHIITWSSNEVCWTRMGPNEYQCYDKKGIWVWTWCNLFLSGLELTTKGGLMGEYLF